MYIRSTYMYNDQQIQHRPLLLTYTYTMIHLCCGIRDDRYRDSMMDRYSMIGGLPFKFELTTHRGTFRLLSNPPIYPSSPLVVVIIIFLTGRRKGRIHVLSSASAVSFHSYNTKVFLASASCRCQQLTLNTNI